MSEFTEQILTRFTPSYKVIVENQPEIIVNCINTSTALAYGNLHSNCQEISERVRVSQKLEDLTDGIYRLFCSLSLPVLVRHVQILYEAMRRAKTLVYLKIGTTGTGGMGPQYPFYP